MAPWIMSKEEYDVLLSFIGWGDFENADIIVFGNEEGAGLYSLEANVKARVRSFGRDEIDGECKYCVIPGNWKEGYYEVYGNQFTNKIVHFKTDQDNPNIVAKPTGGVFNPSIARISLALENISHDDWFRLKDENIQAWNTIQDYVRMHLYTKREGVNTALLDWRPLPRAGESHWPNEYINISEPGRCPDSRNPYLKTFNNPQKRIKLDRCYHPQRKFSNYYQ